MKFCAISDLHLKMWSDNAHLDDGTPLKLKEILDVFKSVCQYSKDNNINNVVIAGDVNDLKNVVHYKPFVFLKEILKEYSDLLFYVISGNHDEASSEEYVSAIQLLDSPNVIAVVSNCLEVENIVFIPWSKDILNKIKKYNNKVLVSHFGLNEGSLSSGLSIKANVGLKDLKKFPLVILGHYHLPQNIENVYYVGSPIQLNRGEKNEEKRFLVVDTDNLTVESIPTSGYRKYFEFEIKEQNDLDRFKEEIQKASIEKNFVTIRNFTNENIEKALGENINARVLKEEIIETQIRGINPSMKIEDQLSKYLEIKDINEKDRSKYLLIAMEALNA